MQNIRPSLCLFALSYLLATGTWAAGPELEGCPVFPADHAWNTPVDTLPVAARSDDYVRTIGASAPLKADFGSGLWNGGPIGIPFVSVAGSQTKMPVSFGYQDESDPGPYPIPPNAPTEGGSQSGGDRHVLVLDRATCLLYETYASYPQANGSWRADSGAVFDLRGYALRPRGWTSADAAGLPILPGLARYDEVAAGEIRHALRFTAPRTQRAYVWPARHYASSITDPAYPPMGQRFRLKNSYDISSFAPQMQVILRALKRYGMILADNGSSWFVSGVPDERWDNEMLHDLDRIPGSAFEAVDTAALMADADSGQAVAATNWSANARLSGPLNRLDLDASLLVAPQDVGAQGNLYVGALTSGGWYFNNGANWLPYVTGALPVFQRGPLASRVMSIVHGLDLTSLIGTKIYTGYGRSDGDMLGQQRYTLVYTVAP